jgi:hypothetical protein
MELKGAITVLRKEAEFLGLSFDGALAFIEKSPLAVPSKVLEAFKVYKLYKG